MPWRSLACLAVFLSSCGGGGRTLLVDVRTDYVAGLEFDTARVTLLSTSEEQRLAARLGDDFTAGRRVGDFTVGAGDQRIDVELVDPTGVVVAGRRAILAVRSGTFAITVTLSRGCEGLECDPTSEACFGDRCVDARCVDGTQPECGEPQCRGAADCTAAGCATATCLDSVCLRVADDSMCGGGLVCHPDDGCVVPSGVDGGTPDGGAPDGGAPDGGMPDAGAPDAGPCVRAVPPCCPGEHDDGTGSCAPEDTCAAGFRDPGDGTCVMGGCLPGFGTDPAGRCGRWEPIALMTPRAEHTATLLPDGRVLIVGGAARCCGTGEDGIAQTEIFDPGTGDVTDAGDLSLPRFGHAAVLLPDGRVLVAGGVSGAEAALQSEIWDGDGWSLAFAHQARYQPSMVVLDDGRVLLTGGADGMRRALATSEILDPGGGAGFVPAGGMGVARQDATLVPFGAGDALVFAGRDGGPIAPVELYQVRVGAWTPFGALITPRRSQVAGLVGGRVLLAGGSDGTSAYYRTAELIEEGGVSFRSVGMTSSSHADGAGAAMGARGFLVVGGQDGGVERIHEAEIFDPATEAWTRTVPLREGRFRMTATGLDERRVLVVGGWPDEPSRDPMGSAELLTLGWRPR